MKNTYLKRTVTAAIGSTTIRAILISLINKEIKKKLHEMKRESIPTFVESRYRWFTALIERLHLNLDKGYIKKDVMMKAIQAFAGDNFAIDRTERLNQVQEAYKEKYGDYPPLFVTLSPSQACNLNCVGCYALSDPGMRSFLPYEMVRKIITDLHDNMSNRFITISGGEPFMYKDNGKTIFDLFAEFKDMYFMVYTNGTLLNQEICEKLARLGNVTPAISIEGWEQETDERRGKGTFNKILEGVKNLQNAGIPFGFSSTITRKNADTFLDEKFYDFLFDKLGTSYLWMFHMMPIGRARDTLPLIINSKQRVDLFRIWERMLYEKKYCVADFWNSGSMVDGCVAYGRWNGYFYINWDGKIMPCVFVPFHEETVYDVYSSGRTIGDALQAPLFQNGRAWQKEYGYCNPDKENILMPCSIRDHFQNFKSNILTESAQPENEDALQMLKDPEIEKALLQMEDELRNLTEEIWQEEILQMDPANPEIEN
jgi:MoaA/NifB/PqqE/SkfB family radical SAM enzyme